MPEVDSDRQGNREACQSKNNETPEQFSLGVFVFFMTEVFFQVPPVIQEEDYGYDRSHVKTVSIKPKPYENAGDKEIGKMAVFNTFPEKIESVNKQEWDYYRHGSTSGKINMPERNCHKITGNSCQAPFK